MDNKKHYIEDRELQLQLVEEQNKPDSVELEAEEQRKFENYLRSMSSRVQYVFDRPSKFYWN